MKNDIHTLTIEDLNPDGNGVARLESGLVVFIPQTAIGDVVEAKIIKQTKTYAVARVETLLSPAPERCEPDCPEYKRCGGCVTRHITFESECEWKRRIVRNAFARIGHLDVDVAPTVALEPDGYRNKVAYPLQMQDGKVTFGYFARHSHTVIPHTACKLQDLVFDEIAMFHVKQIEKYHVPIWNEVHQNGVLRHLVLRKSRDGRFSVCFVAKKRFPEAERMANELRDAFPCIVGIALNLNPDPGNVILGRETATLCGEPTLTDILCGNVFSVSPASFYQVNPDLTERLYTHAKQLADLQPGDVLLDLYCGAGTIGLCLAHPTTSLLGVEIVPDAVENAFRNAENNGRSLENTHFVCGDASAGVAECRKRFGEPDVIIVDPPRKGLSDEVIRTILSVFPKKIVYISCGPATLAANCATLCASGYEVKTAVPYQMFPRTGHIETLCLLERGKKCST